MLTENDQPRIQASHTPSLEETTGEDFVVAVSDRNTERLQACLHPEVHLRALVPSGLQERTGPSAVAARIISWFAGADTIQVLEKKVNLVADRLHISYRFKEQFPDGDTGIIEQNAYCDLDQGHIVSIDLVCTGHRIEAQDEGSEVHHFDAGDLGCSSGLPEEFRHQIESIPVGSILEVTTRDASAKEDLPSMARLLGHQVLSVNNSPNGNTVLTVQRGR